LNELTPELIRNWYQALLINRSRSIAAKAYVRLRQVLNQAVDDERILRNPCRIRRRHEPHRGVGSGQVETLLDHLRQAMAASAEGPIRARRSAAAPGP
jgi:hypothetical protein